MIRTTVWWGVGVSVLCVLVRGVGVWEVVRVGLCGGWDEMVFQGGVSLFIGLGGDGGGAGVLAGRGGWSRGLVPPHTRPTAYAHAPADRTQTPPTHHPARPPPPPPPPPPQTYIATDKLPPSNRRAHSSWRQFCGTSTQMRA